ncbi:hypothetical protein KC238_24400 [Mycobacteroides chelonae]|uniref:hypothetical protein n=1 Tax=Mycobacteroides chelonae TaxID=1774 RepID=UPI001C2BF173|nr:hypothetical protein [Mycobacteroides chelonae]MBV0920403.1 hypothetical protein [Mycobacteroides chelonae]
MNFNESAFNEALSNVGELLHRLDKLPDLSEAERGTLRGQAQQWVEARNRKTLFDDSVPELPTATETPQQLILAADMVEFLCVVCAGVEGIINARVERTDIRDLRIDAYGQLQDLRRRLDADFQEAELRARAENERREMEQMQLLGQLPEGFLTAASGWLDSAVTRGNRTSSE